MIPSLPQAFLLLTLLGSVLGQCPSLSSIYPPSGTRNTQTFNITGVNLDNVDSVSASSGTIASTEVDPTLITFTIDASGLVTVSLTPTDAVNCETLSDVIDVKGPKVSYSISSDLEGQPGTVFFIEGCFPSTCGDNSTSYSVKVGGVDAEVLDEQTLGETSNSESQFYMRLGEISKPIPQANITLVSQYGTEYNSITSINYQPAGNITSISPSKGQRGTEVNITGNNLIGLAGNLDISLANVTLAGVRAEILNTDQLSVIVKAASGSVGPGVIKLTSTQLSQVSKQAIDGPNISVSGLWTYLKDGVITQLVPAAAQEGTTIRICGSSVLGGGNSVSEVSFLGVNSGTFSDSLDNLSDLDVPDECVSALVPIPPGPLPQEGGINITADTKALVTTEAGVTFKYANVSSLKPNRGQEYTFVTINGSHLLSGYNEIEVTEPRVILGSKQATVISYSEDEIVVQAEPPSIPALINIPGSIEIRVSKFGLNFSVKLDNAWTYLEPGSITYVVPDYGQVGTRVTLNGTNLLGYGSSIDYVSILGTESGSPDSDSRVNATLILYNETEVVIEMPSPLNNSYVGPVDILLVADNGAQVRRSSGFQYRESGNITSVSPDKGQRGTYVTINGTNLFGYGTNVTQVKLGDAWAEILYKETSNSSVRIRAARLNVSEATPVEITIISDTNAMVTSSGQPFSYLKEGEIAKVSPDVGQIGTNVNITGTNLLGGGAEISKIYIDGVEPDTITNFSANSIIVVLGNHKPRDPDNYPGEVYIESNTGPIVTGGRFTQMAPGNITSVSPTDGRLGTEIILTGYNLTGFGNSIETVSVGDYTVITDTLYATTAGDTVLVIKAPDAPSGHSGPIKLLIDTGAMIMSTQVFTFLQQGNITRVTPETGAEGRGVFVEGTNLKINVLDITSVTVEESEAQRIVTESDNHVAFIAGPAPNGSLSSLPVRITLSDGSYTEGGSFTYEEYLISVSGASEGQYGTKVELNVPFPVEDILSVKFDDLEADIVETDGNNLSITVEAPRARLLGNYTVDLTIENIDNIVARLRNGFTYLVEGFICPISPSEGQKGTRVQISGENLLGGGNNISTVMFGNVSARVDSYSDKEVNVTLLDNLKGSQSYPFLVDVTVVSVTGATITLVNGFTLIEPGKVTAVSPSSGQYGTVVNITGVGLLQDDKDVVLVMLAGVEADIIGFPFDTNILVLARSANASNGPVTIILSTGAEISSNQSLQFRYLTEGSITRISPSNGTEGTVVRLYGHNLLGGGSSVSTVTLGEIFAEVEEGYNDTYISVIAGGSGNVSAPPGDVVIVSNTGSIVSLEEAWTFNELGYITGISPMTGQQGVVVTIEGSDLLASPDGHIRYVAMAGVQALIREQTNTKIVVEAVYSDYEFNTSPVYVQLDSGPIIISTVNWTYYNASLDSITPKNGINGTYVTLNGRNIIGEPNTTFSVSTVMLGGILCYDIQVISKDSVRVRAGYSESPMSMGEARIDSTSGAYLVLSGQWEYLTNGEVISISPSSAVPGENVTITGTSLVPPEATSVEVTAGRSKSFSAEILSTSVISFRVGIYSPSDQPGVAVPLSIVASDGSTVVSNDTLFTFKSTSIADSVTPSAGQTGTIVVIGGSNLFDVKPVSVYLAGVKAVILYYSSSSITVKAGQGDGISGSVTLVLKNGTFTGLGGSAWTYLPVLTTSNVSSLSGRNGTLVTIDATTVPSEFDLQSVYLGDILATIVSNIDGVVKLSAGHSDSLSDKDNITMNFQDNITLVIESSWSYQSPVSVLENSTLQVGYYNARISLNGMAFRGGDAEVPVSSVTLAGFSTEILTQTDASLVVRVTENFDSSGGSVTGPIVISSEDGAEYYSTSDNITFTYTQVRIDSVSPTRGLNGTRVTFTGVGLLAGADSISSVTLAGVEVASIEKMLDTEITVSAAGHNTSTGLEDIRYTLSSGAMVSISDSWSYLSLGEINTVIPVNGSRGTLVTILGEKLLGGGETADEVYLNGVKAMEVVFSADKVVQVRAGKSVAKEFGEIQIVADTGAVMTSQKADVSFEYIEPGMIDTISPTSGQFGTVVTISGLGLHRGEGVSGVTIAGVEATILSYNLSSVEVIAQRPSTTKSFSGTILVESDHRALVESSSNFTYLREGDITMVKPPQGQYRAEVVIRGNRLFGGGTTIESVLLAGVPADIISLTNTEVSVRVNESVDSVSEDIKGDIVLTADTGARVGLLDSWTYVQVGMISYLIPESGQYGTRVNITGERLTAGGVSIEKVIIGETESLEVLSSTATEVIFRAGSPSNQSSAFAGSIRLVSNDGGVFDSPITWNYTAASQILDVFPANGTGGTVIVISGVNLLGGIELDITSVEIVGIRVNEIISQNDTLIEVEVGFNSDGQEKGGDIVIEADSGALTILQDGWVYLNECPIGQFGNSTNSCSPCDSECEHCFGPSEYECYSCKNFRIITDSQMECVSQCPSFSTIDKECKIACGTNQFQQIKNDGVTYCINCDSQCDPELSCTGQAPSQCSACLNVKLNGVCVESCPVGYFVVNGSTCFPCSEQCEPQAGCRGPEPYDCNKCLNVTIFKSDEQDDECISFCPSGYYTNSTGFCQICHPQCSGGCNGPFSSDCNQCRSAVIIDSDGIRQCVEKCNPSSNYNLYYQNATGHCIRCHSYCSTTAGCRGPSARDCKACLNFTGSNTDVGQFLPLFNDECVRECPNLNYYVDLRTGECRSCHINCTCDCDGPDIADCSCSVEPTVAATDSTESDSNSVFSAGSGTIGLVISICVVMFLVMLIIIAVLAFRLKALSSTTKGVYGFAEGGENTVVQMQQTKFNGDPSLKNGGRNSFTNRDHTSKVNPVFQGAPHSFLEATPSRESGLQSMRNQTGESKEPISSINPVFRIAPAIYHDVPQTENPALSESEAELSQTMSEVYMEMEYNYQQQRTSTEENGNEPISSTSPDPAPPLPPKPGGQPPKTYRPPPPVPQEHNFVVYDDDDVVGTTYPELAGKNGGNFMNELSTQDEMEPSVNILSNLPLPPAAVSFQPQQVGMVEENIYEEEESEAVYEETDSFMAGYNRIPHHMIQQPLPPIPPKGVPPSSVSMPEVPPKIPSRTNRRSATMPQSESGNLSKDRPQ